MILTAMLWKNDCTITRYCESGIYALKQGHGTKKILYELTDSSNIGAPNLLYCPFVLFVRTSITE